MPYSFSTFHFSARMLIKIFNGLGWLLSKMQIFFVHFFHVGYVLSSRTQFFLYYNCFSSMMFFLLFYAFSFNVG